jgi:hypothetical protein
MGIKRENRMREEEDENLAPLIEKDKLDGVVWILGERGDLC